MDPCFDAYSTDDFRMYEFKVRPCMRGRSHDWTDCPFAHPGEKARRRDPRMVNYSGSICADFRKGDCSRGNDCEFSHGVFECWLHPTRYRTQPCKYGSDCKRKVCFFAHTPRQLRILPLKSNGSNQSSISSCHCCLCANEASQVSSPTSTLMGLSRFSPPSSPKVSVSGLNLVPSFVLCNGGLFKEVVNSFEAMDLGSSSSSMNSNFNCYKKDFNGGNGFMSEKSGIGFNESFIRDEQMILPDLDWVSELVM